MGNMKQGRVSVGTMSHKCGKYETGWGECGKKKGRVRMKSVRVVTLPNKEEYDQYSSYDSNKERR